MTETKKPRGFIRPAVIVAAVIAALLLAGTVIIFINHIAFLSSSSYDYAEKYLSGLSDAKLYKTAEEFVSENLTEHEDRELVEKKLAEELGSGKISFARAEGFDEKSPIYTVYIGSQPMFELELENMAAFLSHPSWKVKEFRVCRDTRIGKRLIIDVPSGATLTVNGAEIGRAKADPTDYFALTEFEVALSEQVKADRYDLGMFFLSSDISVVYDGIRLSAEAVYDGVIRYPYPDKCYSHLTLTVPYGSVVEINGVQAGRSYRIESGVTYPFITRFEKDMTGLTTCEVYQISGLFGEPEVKVSYNGAALTDNGSHVYSLPKEQTYSVVIAAPTYATVKINGLTMSSSEISKKKFELPIMEGVSGSSKVRPYMNEYRVEGLLREPEISVTDGNGKPLKVSPYYSSDERTFYTCTESGSLSSKEVKFITNFAKAYVKYIYSANNGLSKNYDAAISYVPYSSLAYSTLKATYKTLYNAPQYKSISYSSLKVLAYYSYSQSSYSAIVTLPFSAVRNGEKHNYEVTLEVLCNYSGSRRVINYKVLENKQG